MLFFVASTFISVYIWLYIYEKDINLKQVVTGTFGLYFNGISNAYVLFNAKL